MGGFGIDGVQQGWDNLEPLNDFKAGPSNVGWIHNTHNGNKSETLLDIESQPDSEEDNENLGQGIKWDFRDETWGNPNFSYNPAPLPFSGPKKGPTSTWRVLPTFRGLFALFWTPVIMSAIVVETNRYANTPVDERGNTRGGSRCVDLTIPELEAFLAIALYMGLKVQPNYSTY